MVFSIINRIRTPQARKLHHLFIYNIIQGDWLTEKNAAQVVSVLAALGEGAVIETDDRLQHNDVQHVAVMEDQ